MILIIQILIALVCMVAIAYTVINLPKDIGNYPFYYLFYKYQMILIPWTFGMVVLLMDFGLYHVGVIIKTIAIASVVIGIFLWSFLDQFKIYEGWRGEVDAQDRQIIIDVKKTLNINFYGEKIYLFCLGISLDLVYVVCIYLLMI